MNSGWIGSAERPMRVAVVGSGPSGFYALLALSRAANLHVQVDIFDRLPTPFGLVRAGIAPDHASIKAVAKSYDRLARLPYVRFFGKVCVGTDVHPEELAAHYDAVVWAVGCESERRLGIPGEDLPGVHSATEFVFWYNGHPEYADRSFALEGARRVVVIGNGNVAMDVVRVLARHPAELAATDIARHAWTALHGSTVTDLALLGRRGPAQAAFTMPELRELSELPAAHLHVDPEGLDWAGPADKRVDLLRAVRDRPVRHAPRTVRLRFCVSPVAFLGGDRVEAVRLVRNRLETRGDSVVAVPEGAPWDEPVDLVFKAVGYRGIALPGVPFDEGRGHIQNQAGRVVDRAGERVPGQYVVGWAKRGPTGVVGTNKPDAEDTVLALLTDLAGRRSGPLPEIGALLEQRGVTHVDWAGWQRIDAEELRRGGVHGKVRDKLVHLHELAAVARETLNLKTVI